MGEVLLVTGSRALTDTRAAREWARSVLHERITDDLERVVAGDARGPDEWAHRPPPTRFWRERWCLSGDVVVGLISEWWTERRWLPPGTPRPSSHDTWAARALARNRAMVEDVARRGNARCLALLAPWSSSRGTQHTMRLAREHGIPVEVLSCPADHGPRGVLHSGSGEDR